MTTYYPIALNIEGRHIVVIGGGAVAARKVAGLRRAGARVTVISPAFDEGLLERDDIERLEESYAPARIAVADLVFACTDDPALNARIADDAHAAGIWCNVVNEPAAGSFIVPAVLREGALTIAVSTAGGAPGLAAAIRDEIAAQLAPEYATLVEELQEIRQRIQAEVDDPTLRRAILTLLCAPCSVKLITRRGIHAWRQWCERIIAHRGRDDTDEPDPETEHRAGGA